MHRRLVSLSVPGLPILSGIAVAIALMSSQPLPRAANSPVTIGGPFTLTSPDGTTVTEQAYLGKWLLVYFGFTSCPDTCPTALLEIATALECPPSAPMRQIEGLHGGRISVHRSRKERR